MENPLKCFAELRDPRVERDREHLLEEILVVAIAAVLSGAESWNDIAEYGEDKREWLKTFLSLPSGIPSHDTFSRVFAALDPEEMEKGFGAWVSSIAKLTAGEVIAIDGKACAAHARLARRHSSTGKIERKIRYYITSLRADAARLNSVVRQHWGIENKLHWMLDVGFGEDLDRKRAGHAA